LSLFFLSLFFSFFLFPLVIFLHILLFGDGIQFWKLRQQGYEVITCTLGEFDEGLRASTTSPAIQICFMASKQIQQKHFQGSYDTILDLFLADLEALISGVPFYCQYLQRVMTVVAVFHGFEADLPGRCKANGFKNPNHCLGQHCPCCHGAREKLEDDFKEPGPATRTTEEINQLFDNLRTTASTESLYRTALLQQNGMSRISSKTFLFFSSLLCCVCVLIIIACRPLEVSWSSGSSSIFAGVNASGS